MRIDILKAEQNEDGSYVLEYDYDDEYLELMKERLGKKELTEEEISKFVMGEIEKAIHNFSSQKEDAE